MDLYSSGLAYPVAKSVPQKYLWAKHLLEDEVHDPLFRQHFAVHETEAWLMSDPMMLPSLVRAKLGHVERPESVNFTNPPSRVIDRAYRHAIGRTYKKTRDGVKLFHRLDPELAYQRCPHLKLLLDEMLDLAKPR